MENSTQKNQTGTWEFVYEGQTTSFSGTYQEYLEYCDRTCNYANGRYCNNISDFTPTQKS